MSCNQQFGLVKHDKSYSSLSAEKSTLCDLRVKNGQFEKLGALEIVTDSLYTSHSNIENLTVDNLTVNNITINNGFKQQAGKATLLLLSGEAKVTVPSTNVSSTSVIVATFNSNSSPPSGTLYIKNITQGISFDIFSTSYLDYGQNVFWNIVA